MNALPSAPPDIIDLRDHAHTSPAPARNRLKESAARALVVLALLNILDIITTRVALARGAVESNPLARLLLGGGHVEVVKLAAIAVLAWRLRRRPATIGLHAFIWFTAGIYFLVVTNNLVVLAHVA